MGVSGDPAGVPGVGGGVAGRFGSLVGPARDGDFVTLDFSYT